MWKAILVEDDQEGCIQVKSRKLFRRQKSDVRRIGSNHYLLSPSAPIGVIIANQ